MKSKLKLKVPSSWPEPEEGDVTFAPALTNGKVTGILLYAGGKVYSIPPAEILALSNTLQALYPELYIHPSHQPDIISGDDE